MVKQFSVFVNIGGKVGSSFTAAINTVESSLNRLTKRFKTAADGARSAMKGINESAKGLGALAAAGGLSFGIKHALGSGAELAHELQALRNAGRTAGEVSSAIAEANKTIGKLPTTTLSENLKVLNETTGAYGSFQHALENLEFNQRIGSMLKNTVGDKIGDPGEMFNQLVRAFEIRGTAADHHVYQKEVAQLYKAMMFTRGNVNPGEFLNFAQQANPAIKNYDEEFLTKVAPSLIQEFGGERAGSRAGAWYNAIMGKTRDARMAGAWNKLGLLKESDVLKNKKTGDVIGWQPGAMAGTHEAMANPLAWTERYLIPALQKKGGVDGKGINVDDQMAVSKELGRLFRNSEANRFANAISQARDRKRLHKDSALINAVPDSEKAYEETLSRDPKMAWGAVKAGFENLGEALTVPLMEPAARAFTMLAKGVNALAQVFVANPNLATLVGGLAAAMAAMAALRLASFIFGLTGLGRALMFLAVSPLLRMATGLFGLARALTAIGVALAVGSVARLRGLVMALVGLSAAGGAKAALVGLGRGLVACLVPMALFTAGLRVMRLALIGTGIGAALVALGTAFQFVSNNWEGMGKGLEAFGAAFEKALPPDLAARIKPVLDFFKTLFSGDGFKFDNAQWEAWGNQFGTQLGTKVTEWTGKIGQFVEALNKIKDFEVKWSDIIKLDDMTSVDFVGPWVTKAIEEMRAGGARMGSALGEGVKTAVETAVNWAAAGATIIEKLAEGIKEAAGSLASALSGAVRSAWDGALARIGIGGGTARAAGGTAAGAPSSPPARAIGGPVTGGKTYLVGERGPELFRAGATGRIDTHAALKRIAAANAETGTHRSIMRAEGTAGKDPYNTVLGYGRYGTPDKPLTDMSLKEAYGFGRSVRARHGSSSALGAFQIVGRTMKDAMGGTGLGWGDKFDPENQRKMADWIQKKQGFGAWEGFKRHPEQLAAARAGTDVEGGSAARTLALAGAPARRAGTIASASGGGHSSGGGGGALAARVAGLSHDVARATRASTSTKTEQRGPVSITISVTAPSGDGQDIASAVRREMTMVLAKLESDQRGSLND